jgi:hypothetical protein
VQDAIGTTVSSHLKEPTVGKITILYCGRHTGATKDCKRSQKPDLRSRVAWRGVVSLPLHFKPTMSSNFGTGQGLFGSIPSNQNKNQATSAPGSAPAAGASPFANMGANTTNSSVFGGSGAGNTPAGGGTTGSIFGTGGSAFGSSGNTNTATPTAAGAGTGAGTTTPFGSGFAGLYASYSAFMNHLIQRIT